MTYLVSYRTNAGVKGKLTIHDAYSPGRAAALAKDRLKKMGYVATVTNIERA